MTLQLQRDGNAIGELARVLFDRKGNGVLVDRETNKLIDRLEKTRDLMNSGVPIFEGAFAADGGLFYADVVDTDDDGKRHVIEVKATSGVRKHHVEDAAIQWHIMSAACGAPETISIGYVDSQWTYKGDDNYLGLIKTQDITDEARDLARSVPGWLRAAEAIIASPTFPDIGRGDQCKAPHACGYAGHCRSLEPLVEFPADVLPGVRTKELKAEMRSELGVRDLRDISDTLLNHQQAMVKQATISSEIFFDAKGAEADLAIYGYPAYFLDFETIAPSIPFWKGNHAYERIPFQYSLHVLAERGDLENKAFLHLGNDDPARSMAERLIADCGETGPIFVYNAGFESSVIREQAAKFEDLSAPLLNITKRIVDLMKVAKARYYHPSQQGSWSIKKLLPAIVPDLDYGNLEGVKNGGMAMDAYREALREDATEERREELRGQLIAYCALDTLAMVKIWEFFRGTPRIFPDGSRDLRLTSVAQ